MSESGKEAAAISAADPSPSLAASSSVEAMEQDAAADVVEGDKTKKESSDDDNNNAAASASTSGATQASSEPAVNAAESASPDEAGSGPLMIAETKEPAFVVRSSPPPPWKRSPEPKVLCVGRVAGGDDDSSNATTVDAPTLIPLQLGAEVNPLAPKEGFTYTIEAPASGMTRKGEDTLTYMNKDQVTFLQTRLNSSIMAIDFSSTRSTWNSRRRPASG